MLIPRARWTVDPLSEAPSRFIKRGKEAISLRIRMDQTEAEPLGPGEGLLIERSSTDNKNLLALREQRESSL